MRFLAKIVKGILMLFLLAAVVAVAAIGIPNAVEMAGQRGNIYTADQIASSGESYDCILVLGAAVYADGTPSPILQDRLDTAASLYFAGVAPKIIVSGDDESDQSYDEVTNMKAYLVRSGVPSEDIFCDHAGINTYDSAYRTKNVFSAETMVVVTQTYHLYRALFDANSLGVKSVGAIADMGEYANQRYYSFREAFARVSDFYKVLTKQTSTYLSEPVSLEQDGDVTSW